MNNFILGSFTLATLLLTFVTLTMVYRDYGFLGTVTTVVSMLLLFILGNLFFENNLK